MKRIKKGANDQIGKAITLHFKSKGISFIALPKEKLDICSASSLKQAFDHFEFDIVINCAAFTNTEIAEIKPLEAEYVNIGGVKLLAEKCKVHQKFLIHLSTNCVFNGLKATPYRENDSVNPLSVYGQTKYQGEEEIKKMLNEYIILRTSWSFSEFEGHNFVLKILKKGIAEKKLRIVDDQFGCPTSAHSLALTLGKICKRHWSLGDLQGIYHFCSHEPVSWYEFSEEIFRLACQFNIADVHISPAKTGEVPTNLRRPVNGILNTYKMRKLGFEMPHWREDLQKVMEKIQII